VAEVTFIHYALLVCSILAASGVAFSKTSSPYAAYGLVVAAVFSSLATGIGVVAPSAVASVNAKAAARFNAKIKT
jgi:hypothetical protein